MANKTIIKKPMITEKASLMSALGTYVFLVEKAAAAPEVKKAVEAIYKVHVVRVRMINIPGKMRRIGRNLAQVPGYRKAVVTLKKGETIDLATA